MVINFLVAFASRIYPFFLAIIIIFKILIIIVIITIIIIIKMMIIIILRVFKIMIIRPDKKIYLFSVPARPENCPRPQFFLNFLFL